MPHNTLLSPITVGDLSLRSRVLMAPLTRSRSKQPGDIPWELNAEYYAQRAGAGLIISEATQVSPRGKGYAFTPGIFTDEQVAGWKLVTDAVHERGGSIVLQLWHVGRISHTDLQPGGEAPVAPSALRAQTQTYTSHDSGMVDVSEPRALETHEIPTVVDEFRHGAQCAKDAGFDGVEIHGANGYLLDQFIRDGSNHRTDDYGGSIVNRCRFPLEVVDTVVGVFGAGRVGYRISPTGEFNSMADSTPAETFGHLARELSARGLMYLHVVEAFAGGERQEPVLEPLRAAFSGEGRGGVYLGNGGYTPDSAEQRLTDGLADAITFGTMYIANPDLAERVARGGPYNEPNRETYYSGTAVGYTDYPALGKD
ncbi:MAG: alkene reductase [Planctomycetota bacterium]